MPMPRAGRRTSNVGVALRRVVFIIAVSYLRVVDGMDMGGGSVGAGVEAVEENMR